MKIAWEDSEGMYELLINFGTALLSSGAILELLEDVE